MNSTLSSSAVVILMTACSLAYAQTAEKPPATADSKPPVAADAKSPAPAGAKPSVAAKTDGAEKKDDTEKKPSAGRTREFGGFSLGAGLSLTHDLGDNDRVQSATIVNGIVRVTAEQNDVARIMLESHYFFEGDDDYNLFWFIPLKKKRWGHGPFVAIQPGTNDIVEAIAFGWMIGFRHSDESVESWNIGFGAIVDPSVQVLGDGFVANAPPPAGETEVRYKTKSQWGWMIIASFAW